MPFQKVAMSALAKLGSGAPVASRHKSRGVSGACPSWAHVAVVPPVLSPAQGWGKKQVSGPSLELLPIRGAGFSEVDPPDIAVMRGCLATQVEERQMIRAEAWVLSVLWEGFHIFQTPPLQLVLQGSLRM